MASVYYNVVLFYMTSTYNHLKVSQDSRLVYKAAVVCRHLLHFWISDPRIKISSIHIFPQTGPQQANHFISVFYAYSLSSDYVWVTT